MGQNDNPILVVDTLGVSIFMEPTRNRRKAQGARHKVKSHLCEPCALSLEPYTRLF
jgi:hypothetical protein